MKRVLRVIAAVALGVGLLEVVLHVAPGLLPASYRDRFPAHGVELFRRGALAETPVTGFAMPLVPTPWDAPPPLDLMEMGLVPPDFTLDWERFPHARTPSDARGLTNREAYEHAPIVLVGDSFLVAGGCVEPPGLVVGLEEETGRRAYSLGVAGIGPLREEWLLEHVGLPLDPDLVLWFFFGGNDLSDARQVREWIEAGHRVRSELPGYVAPPRFLLADWIRWAAGGGAATGTGGGAATGPVPPLTLQGAGGSGGGAVWFHPAYFARLAMSKGAWREHAGWTPTREALLRSRDRARARGTHFVLVYLPSKAEAYLPHVVPDAPLWLRHLSFGLDQPLGLTPEQVLDEPRAHRLAMGQVLAELCEQEGIPFFSATPILEELVAQGRAAYLAADTHWTPIGMRAVLEPLLAFLERRGLLSE